MSYLHMSAQHPRWEGQAAVTVSVSQGGGQRKHMKATHLRTSM